MPELTSGTRVARCHAGMASRPPGSESTWGQRGAAEIKILHKIALVALQVLVLVPGKSFGYSLIFTATGLDLNGSKYRTGCKRHGIGFYL